VASGQHSPLSLSPLPSPLPAAARALQIHNRYLVAETDEGVTIIDQHALHERILYEQLRQRVAAGAMETQNLLVPEPVDLSPPRLPPPWSSAICWPGWVCGSSLSAATRCS